MPMVAARRKNYHSRPYRGCERVGWPSHGDVGQPLNHQHEMSNMPAEVQTIFFGSRHQHGSLVNFLTECIFWITVKQKY
jgi:hypothetical protein